MEGQKTTSLQIQLPADGLLVLASLLPAAAAAPRAHLGLGVPLHLTRAGPGGV